MVDAVEPQDQVVAPQDHVQVRMWDHHQQLRFTLAWAAQDEECHLRDLVVRSLLATFRGQPKRAEPAQGFQLHALADKGTVYYKVLFYDGRECQVRALRYQVSEKTDLTRLMIVVCACSCSTNIKRACAKAGCGPTPPSTSSWRIPCRGCANSS